MSNNDQERIRARRDPRLQLTVSHTASESRLVCKGEIDIFTAPELSEAIAMVMTTNPPLLFVDWQRVSFVGVAGVDVLESAARVCRARGIKLQVALSDSTRRVLDIVGWGSIEEAPGAYRLPSEVEDALVRALSMN